jgi:hypothetical protein
MNSLAVVGITVIPTHDAPHHRCSPLTTPVTTYITISQDDYALGLDVLRFEIL